MEDAQTERLRSFLAWRLVWLTARAVTVYGEATPLPLMLSWVAEPALNLLCNISPHNCEMETRWDDVSEYFTSEDCSEWT